MFIDQKEIKKAERDTRPLRKKSLLENKNIQEFFLLIRDITVIVVVVLIIREVFIASFQINGSSMEPSYHSGEYILVDKFSYFDAHNSFGLDPDAYSNPVTRFLAQGISLTLGNLPIHIGDPSRGDVVVIKPGVSKEKEYYIKRIIGLPGDTIQIASGQTWIQVASTGAFIALDEPYTSSDGTIRLTELDPTIMHDTFAIPLGYYWVMGDNRTNSADSRSCFYRCTDGNSDQPHFIARDHILGKVLVDFGYFHMFSPNPGGILPVTFGPFAWIYPPRFFSSPSTAEYPELSGTGSV